MEVNKILQQAYYDPSTGLIGAQKLYQKLKVQGVTSARLFKETGGGTIIKTCCKAKGIFSDNKL